jgi:hypothetical protein
MGKIGKYHEIRGFRDRIKVSQTWKTAKKQAQTPFSNHQKPYETRHRAILLTIPYPL